MVSTVRLITDAMLENRLTDSCVKINENGEVNYFNYMAFVNLSYRLLTQNLQLASSSLQLMLAH